MGLDRGIRRRLRTALRHPGGGEDGEDDEDAAALARICAPFPGGFRLRVGPVRPLCAPQEQRSVVHVVQQPFLR